MLSNFFPMLHNSILRSSTYSPTCYFALDQANPRKYFAFLAFFLRYFVSVQINYHYMCCISMESKQSSLLFTGNMILKVLTFIRTISECIAFRFYHALNVLFLDQRLLFWILCSLKCLSVSTQRQRRRDSSC